VTVKNPILHPHARAHGGSEFTRSEVQLANRNSGIHLEMLKHDVTPVGMHYLLSHFDIPYVQSGDDWRLAVSGLVDSSLQLSLQRLSEMPQLKQTVTLECAGNGRALMEPRWCSMPWSSEAVGTASWTGTSLRHVLELAGVQETATTVVFSGADKGVDGGDVHRFERSLELSDAFGDEVMLAWLINEQPLPPQHGFPLRLIVPGWYGMASVKWLDSISITDQPFTGHQQVKTYNYRQSADDPGRPVTTMRVRSLMIPPGIPDWYTRRRLLQCGTVMLEGRAWSGSGTPILQVQIAVEQLPDDDAADNTSPSVDSPGGYTPDDSPSDLIWVDAELRASSGRYAWCGWQLEHDFKPGHYRLRCRATDARGKIQPLQAPWDNGGFGNNAVHTVDIWVVDEIPGV